jgi:hypothetical protein
VRKIVIEHEKVLQNTLGRCTIEHVFGADDPIASARDAIDAIDELAGLDPSALSTEALSSLLIEIDTVRERLRAVELQVMGAWDARRAWAEDGALSASSWMAHRTTTSKRDASRMVRAARLAFRCDRTAKALDAGDVSASKVEVLAAAVKRRERLFDRDEDVLLDAAATLDVDDFTVAAKHWRAAADDEMSRIDALHTFDTRGVTLATTIFGRMEMHASLDAEGGATVDRALDAYDRPDPVDGVTPPRTLEQRRADALVQICSEALDRRHRQAGSRHVPNVDLVLDADRLDGGATFDPMARCEIDRIGPVGRAVAERMLCDSAVCRVVMQGVSEVLDLGRRQRLPSRALRRALERRDRHCVFPGCDAPLRWCDVHHLVHWAHGGATDLDNCVLLCRRHHVLCHEGAWRLARGPDGRVVVAERGSVVRSGRRRRRRGIDDEEPPGPAQSGANRSDL